MNVLAPRVFGSKKKTYPEGREHFGKQKVIANGGILGTHVGFKKGYLVQLKQIKYFIGTEPWKGL